MATFVLVHGAWQGGWIWQRVKAKLEALGHRVFTPTLDGCAERQGAIRPGITTETQAEELARMLFFEDLRDVVLVGTSLGGKVICKVAELQRDRVRRLVFADAVVLFDGEASADSTQRSTSIVTDLTIAITEDHQKHLFRNFDEATRAWTLERFAPQPIATVRDAAKLPTFWKTSWKASVIWCRQAPRPGEEHLRRCAQALNAAWYELDDGHYPMLTSPDKLAELIAID